MLTVGEHIAILQRAQAIAAADHGALVRAQHELAEARAERKRLRWRARRCAPAMSGLRVSGAGGGWSDDCMAPPCSWSVRHRSFDCPLGYCSFSRRARAREAGD